MCFCTMGKGQDGKKKIMLKYPNFPEREKCQAACCVSSCFKELRKEECSFFRGGSVSQACVYVCAHVHMCVGG